MDEDTIQVALLPDRISKGLSSHQDKMAHYLFEMACMDGIEELSTTRALPHWFLKLLKKVMTLFDESTLSLLGQLRRSGSTVQCRPGCSHCCYHMPVGLSIVELIYIYRGMMEAGGIDRVFRHCLEAEESWAEVLRQSMSRSASGDARNYSAEETLRRYQRAGQPCPFLERAMCLIYPYRPFACRMHFALSPPYWCDPLHFQNPHTVQFNLEPGETVYDALERLNNRFQLGLSDAMVCGLLELTVNVMKFEKIHWLH